MAVPRGDGENQQGITLYVLTVGARDGLEKKRGQQVQHLLRLFVIPFFAVCFSVLVLLFFVQ